MHRIAIIQRSGKAPSQTFVRAHAERLPNVAVVIESTDGIATANGRPVFSRHVLHRARRKFARVLLRRPPGWDFDRACEIALRRNKAGVVLAEFATTALAAAGACRRANVPLVVHFHGFDAYRRDVREKYQGLFDQASAVVAVSRAMQRQLIGLGCPRHKVIYNPCGVDCSWFQGANPAAAPPRFIAVGRMVEKKAPHLALAAFALVLSEHPDARMQFVGDGRLLGLCRDLAEALGMQHAVNFLGAQPHDVVQREMRNARAFVQHSITAADGDSEGTPVAVLEAGASGLPVIATRHAGIPDVVSHGETGFLVGERDVGSMAAHMLELIHDPAAAGRLGRNAAQRVRHYYGMDQSIDRLARVLHAAAGGASLHAVRASIETELAPPSGPLEAGGPDRFPRREVLREVTIQPVLHTLRAVLVRKQFRQLAAIL